MDNPNYILTKARTVASQMAALDGIEAIVLGGSRSKHVHDLSSDIDIYCFYSRFPDYTRKMNALSALIDKSRTAIVSKKQGEWGWWDGGAVFWLDGTLVELSHRKVSSINSHIRRLLKGKYGFHPEGDTIFGCYTYGLLADIQNAIILYDPKKIVHSWKKTFRVYPPKLRNKLIQDHLFG